MNYLAHLLLSGDDSLLRIGNLAGDFVKGVDTTLLHPVVQQGIALHRAIDAYTDSHDTVWRSKSRVGPAHTRLAGVLVDIFYDHYLAIGWHMYCDRSLENYVGEICVDLRTHSGLLPPLLKDTAPQMIAEDWLVSYRTIEGIGRALTRIEQRLGGKLDLSHGTDEMKKHYADLDGDFREFFPQVRAHAQALVKQAR